MYFIMNEKTLYTSSNIMRGCPTVTNYVISAGLATGPNLATF
jgi:hypothetical protein